MTDGRWWLPLIGALALVACASPPPKNETGRGDTATPVVVISIDTLRADRLPAYGYVGVETPAIDALAGDGVVFDNAYSHTPLTLPSHASL